MKWQVNEVLAELDQFGISKHEIKETLKSNGIKDWHDMGQHTGIHQDSTQDTYRSTIMQFCNWCKSEYGIKDITKIDGNHTASWLEKKGFDDGVKPNTFDGYASAVQKFSLGLEMYTGKEYEWNPQISEVKEMYKETLGSAVHVDRHFENPTAVWQGMDNKLAGEVMHSCGLRINEIHTVEERDGNKWFATGKGGYQRVIHPSADLQPRMREAIETNGSLGYETRAEQNALRDDIKQSCEINSEKYSGAHSFRYNFARNFYVECRAQGMGHHEAVKATSEVLGHHREDVVEKFYLK